MTGKALEGEDDAAQASASLGKIGSDAGERQPPRKERILLAKASSEQNNRTWQQ